MPLRSFALSFRFASQFSSDGVKTLFDSEPDYGLFAFADFLRELGNVFFHFLRNTNCLSNHEFHKSSTFYYVNIKVVFFTSFFFL